MRPSKATGYDENGLSEAEMLELHAMLDVGDKKGMRAFFCRRGVHAFSTYGKCVDCSASMVVPSEVIEVRFKQDAE